MLSALALSLLAATRLITGQVLVDFQVAQPPVVPAGVKTCTVPILVNNFDSFGDPAVVQYTPPTDCGVPGTWSAITLNFTATCNGTQFDRLSAISFHNVEIWRTSTPEPTPLPGILWTFIKDVTRYMPLFAKPGTLILDLNNIVDPNQGLTGEYLVRLSATFYASSLLHPPAPAANTIIPISNLSPNQANYVSVPPALDTVVNFPRNAVKAFAELYASGNGNEEFWYFNTANQFVPDLPDGTTFGQGPLREVRLLVDGKVAGAALPWAVFFTGAIVPTVWRPITSYGAMDLPTYFVDLTPFLPVLTDGQNHTVSIDVVSAEDDHTINQNWFVSGNIQVFTGPSSKPTTGKILSYSADLFPVTKTTGSVGTNGDVNVTVSSTRKISVKSLIVPGVGLPTTVEWTQDLSFTNTQNFLDDTFVQNVHQLSTGKSLSLHNGVPVISDNFNFPVEVDFTAFSDNSGFSVVVDHTYTRTLLPAGPLVLSSTINSHQRGNGSAVVIQSGRVRGNGTNINEFSFIDARANTYTRQVGAENNTILFDRIGGSLSGKPFFGIFDKSPQTHLVTTARVPGNGFRKFGTGGK